MAYTRSPSPSSPFRGQPPKWLKSSRGFSSLRYLAKVAALGLLCITLGWSMVRLYDKETGRQYVSAAGEYHHEIFEDGYDEMQTFDNAGYFLDRVSADSAIRIPINRSKDNGYKSYTGTLIHSVSDTISSWNPWGKGDGNQDFKANNLLTSGSEQTEEEVVTLARSRIGKKPTLGKITIITGGEQPVYEQALKTHDSHNHMHGYSMHTLRRSILNDVWSKPAYILSVMMRELAKPKAQRLQWLFWVDADTIIINPYVPAETFLPPLGFQDVHLLVSHDFNGLNNGVFPIRVHPWSVELLAAVIAYPTYKSNEHLSFRDQSAMGELLKTPKFARHTVQAPQRWFNAYQGEINETIAPFQTRPGDLLVHFAGVPNRDERMEFWLRRVELHLPEWEMQFKHTSYKTETQEFWDNLAATRARVRKEAGELQVAVAEREAALKQAVVKYNSSLSDEQKQRIDTSIKDMRKVFEDDDTKVNLDAIRAAMEKMKEGTSMIQSLLDQESKQLLTSAHIFLFAAEQSLYTNTEHAAATRPQSQSLEEAIAHFKETLLNSESRPDSITAEIEVLRQKQQEYEGKLGEVKAKEARQKEAQRVKDEKEKEAEAEKMRKLQALVAEAEARTKAEAEAEAAKAEAAKVEAVKVEAAKLEAAKAEVAKAEVAKAEAAKAAESASKGQISQTATTESATVSGAK